MPTSVPQTEPNALRDLCVITILNRDQGGEGLGVVAVFPLPGRAAQAKSSGIAPIMKTYVGATASVILLLAPLALGPVQAAALFDGRFFTGEGDVEYLQLLDNARRMYQADPEFQNLAMLYTPQWNGLVEGPTWGAWWVQNSYGPTYCALPFYEEPLVTFLQNSQDLWFDRMGDGKTSYVWNGKDSWVPPDGCLMDCANDTWAMHRQGDGRVSIHDWGLEFTAAGGLMQSEWLLVSRDPAALAKYLPKLERCASFIESRRDPKNNLFLAGPAGNLLAPSYAGCKRPDGTYGMAYLTGLSVTYIGFLDRLIELEKLAGRTDQVQLWFKRRATAREGLALLATDEGYFIKSMDPDGTRHGIHGAVQYGYFEASPNHDAICFRVVDESQSRKIYQKLASIPGLRPHDLILANCPSLDDMYEAPQGLWGFGTWVNGGHWTTCEARALMAYYRLGQYEDARRSMKKIMTFARQFRLDNPLVNFGNAVYQPGEAINLTYDAFGAPSGLIRGLFEYLYSAEGLRLALHIPEGITRIEQRFPIRFGTKRLYLAAAGSGPITSVWVNGKAWKSFAADSVFLPYQSTPEQAAVQIVRGGAETKAFQVPPSDCSLRPLPALAAWPRPAKAPVIAANELPLRIGADSDGGSRFIGDFARVCVFSRALNADEIARLSEADPGALLRDPAVVGNWTFEPADNGTFPNAAGKAAAAKSVGAVSLVDSPFGKALHLTGDSYLEVPTSPILGLANGATWHVLVRPGTTKGRLIDKCPVGGATGYTFDTYPGNALRLISDSGTISAEAKLAPGRWTHLVGTVDAGGTSALYVDGKLVASAKRMTEEIALQTLLDRAARLRRFNEAMITAGFKDAYEAAHARLAVNCLLAAHERADLLAAGKLTALPPRSQVAADKLYLSAAMKLCDGLEKLLNSWQRSGDARKRQIYGLWTAASRA
jgi:hypothetical protein